MSTIPRSDAGEADYAWEVATLFPPQGDWSEEEYLRLTAGANRRIEFTDGRLEFLAMPTDVHESLVEFLYFALRVYVERNNLGIVRWTGIRLRIRPGKYTLPDVIFLHKDHLHARHNRAWDGADLVMEVVSDDPKDRERDYQQKLRDYAAAGVPEYWIIDREQRVVNVYRLVGGQFALHGQFRPGQQAASHLLPGFSIDVAALFAAADDVPE